MAAPGSYAKKLFTLLDLCVSSLRRGHANLLCIVPILTDDPRRESEHHFGPTPEKSVSAHKASTAGSHRRRRWPPPEAPGEREQQRETARGAKWLGIKKLFTLLDLCVSSLRRGHANLLCIVPILTDDPRRESEH